MLLVQTIQSDDHFQLNISDKDCIYLKYCELTTVDDIELLKFDPRRAINIKLAEFRQGVIVLELFTYIYICVYEYMCIYTYIFAEKNAIKSNEYPVIAAMGICHFADAIRLSTLPNYAKYIRDTSFLHINI